MKFNVKYCVALLLAIPSITAQVAVYWGQNSFGGEQLLALYCQTLEVEVVLVSFLNGYPNLSINFGGQCNEKFNSGLLHCSKIGEDIKSCQAQGKKIFMSLGGAVGEYGFQSEVEGEAFAEVLWNKFGGGQDNERPFDDAIIDGFDFDVENKNQVGYVAMAKKLREYFSESSRQYYLSAAPQCVYPDQSVGDLMLQVPLDYAFVQFYNNPCAVEKDFNWKTWSDWAANSPNPNVKLFLGLPGAPSSAGSGYIDSTTICETIDNIRSSPNFGGVMFWDASSSFGNGDMVSVVNNHINGIGQLIPSPQESSAPRLLPGEASSSVASILLPSLNEINEHGGSYAFGTPTIMRDDESSTTTSTMSTPPTLVTLDGSYDTNLTDANLNFEGLQKGVQINAESYDETLTQVTYETVLEIVPMGNDDSVYDDSEKTTTNPTGAPNLDTSGNQVETTAGVRPHHHHKKLAFTTVTAYTTVYV